MKKRISAQMLIAAVADMLSAPASILDALHVNSYPMPNTKRGKFKRSSRNKK